MGANDLPFAALAERRDKRGMLLSCWLVAHWEDALGRAGRNQQARMTGIRVSRQRLPSRTHGRTSPLRPR